MIASFPTTSTTNYFTFTYLSYLLPTAYQVQAYCPLPTAHCHHPHFFPCTSGNMYQASLWEKKKTKTKTKKKPKKNQKTSGFAKQRMQKQLNSVVPRLWVQFRPSQGVAFPCDRDDDSYTFDKKIYIYLVHTRPFHSAYDPASPMRARPTLRV